MLREMLRYLISCLSDGIMPARVLKILEEFNRKDQKTVDAVVGVFNSSQWPEEDRKIFLQLWRELLHLVKNSSKQRYIFVILSMSNKNFQELSDNIKNNCYAALTT